MALTKSPLTLLLVAAAASTGLSDAANVRQRNLEGLTITTNKNTYTSYPEYAVAMLAAVNKQRATAGLPPLCLNRKLHNAAQSHSDDMAKNNYMGHGGMDGSTMSERISQYGYEWSAVAENVAAGQINVADVMAAWIESPEHLENIMGDYTMFGSAYAFNKNTVHQHYWTQDFGSSETEQCDGSAPKPIIPHVAPPATKPIPPPVTTNGTLTPASSKPKECESLF
ncbi:hypothetical protein PsorP6_003183 [Peronosclerospora sorghi]|uniref:Uncharacterized protein n=1 Tax=Peronosclerospora sorghi TaxID=230839 RepID=A0ACC0VK73_9STRA|nr:hypothetical protein PsorP6_003183 [Peronosclerospora sorghi]